MSATEKRTCPTVRFGNATKMPEPDNRRTGPYTPNTIPKPELIRSALFVVGLSAYLVYSITQDGIYLAGPHGIGTTYSGFSFFLIGAAMLFGIANLAANVIVDILPALSLRSPRSGKDGDSCWARPHGVALRWVLVSPGGLTAPVPPRALGRRRPEPRVPRPECSSRH